MDNRYSIDRRSVRTDAKTPSDDSVNVGGTYVALGSLLSSGSAVLILSQAAAVRSNAFYEFGSYVLEVMSISPYMVYLVNGTAATSVALFLTSFIAGICALMNKRFATKIALVFTLIAAIMVLVGGIIIVNFTSDIESQTSSDGTSLEGPGRELQDFSVAMYGACCLEPGFVHADAAIKDFGSDIRIDTSIYPANRPEGSSLPYGSLQNDMLTCEEFYKNGNNRLNIKGFQTAVDPCVGNFAHLQYFRVAVSAPQLCSILNSTEINIDGESLFGVPITSLTKGQEVLVIASDASPSSNGCGGGKIKGFQYTVFVWFKHTCRPVGLFMVIVGTINILLFLTALASLSMSKTSSSLNLEIQDVNNYINARRSVRVSMQRNQNPPMAEVVTISIPSNVDDKL